MNFCTEFCKAQIFPCEYRQIKKNTYFEEHLEVAASGDPKVFSDTAKRIIVTAQDPRN